MGALSPGLLLAIAYLAFISLGLPDPLAGIAWPSVRETFHLHQRDFGWVFIALGCGYCASGFFGGWLTHVLGLGNLLWLSSAAVAAAMLMSAVAPAWPVFVASAVLWGLGSGGIDAGINAYASKHFSHRHVNWLHACYNLGATVGPLLMTGMLLASGSWRGGYLVVGALLSAMAGLFLLTRPFWQSPAHVAGSPSASAGLAAALRMPLVWGQVLLFFLYVGAEFTVGQWCFTLLTEARDVPTRFAGLAAASYYAAIGVGRVLAGFLTQHLTLDQLVRAALLLALAGGALWSFVSHPAAAAIALILIGLGLAPVFPCLMARTPSRLGEATATHAVGFQVSAGMLGAASMPGLAGLAAQTAGLDAIPQLSLLLLVLLTAAHELLVAASPKSPTAVPGSPHPARAPEPDGRDDRQS